MERAVPFQFMIASTLLLGSIYNVLGLVALSIVMVVPSLILLYRIIRPTIITYPWPKQAEVTEGNSSNGSGRDKDTTVVFAGSFNPAHNGHLAMIQYLSERYKEVILVIGMNPNKTYKVAPNTRAEILEKMVATLGLDKSRVRVKVVSGYIWRYAMSQNATIFFRGIRTWEKDGAEERALHILNSWGPLVYGPLKWPLRTYFMEGDPSYESLSSTFIRDACLGSESNTDAVEKRLEGLVPAEAIKDIVTAYK